ncbi:hypothetical protein ABZ891_36920 [Streptomyces sp. NPDC047023]|uniref:DUF6923 family protein n=1 Tax=Streptomyces sp. NPDC047023 TaxID=3155139 RepID=UPI0033D9E055
MTGLKALWRSAAISTVTLATIGAPLVHAVQLPQQSAVRAEAGKTSSTYTKQPGTPFACNGQILLSSGNDNQQVYVGVTGPGTINFSPIGAATTDFNAIGLNPEDQFVYAIDANDQSLLRIDSAGLVTDLGAITGLPTGELYTMGGFDADGDYYVVNPGDAIMYRIDVATQTATPIPLTGTTAPVPSGWGDITYADGYFWGADNTGHVIRVNPTTGAVDRYDDAVPLPSGGTPLGYGGAFTCGNGDLGFIDNGGRMVRVSVTDPTSATPTFETTSTQTSPSAFTGVDATSCFLDPVDLQLTKAAEPAGYVSGDQITYTLTVRNNGPNPSSGYTVTAPGTNCAEDSNDRQCTSKTNTPIKEKIKDKNTPAREQ